MEQVVFALSIDEIDTNQPKIHRKIHSSLWILKISRKPKKKARTLGKILGFGFFILCDFHLLAYVSSLTFGHCLGLYLP
jgi:hypothetical protein